MRDFQDYLDKSMQVRVEVEGRDSLEDWQSLGRSIVVGTRDQLPGCGTALKGPKDYEIVATPERLTVCGYDERGAMYGLYNLEARMNLREGPFLPADLKTVRHSLYDVRMVMSWMGWMEWPDALLSHLAHDGFDGIFASAYANPNGDRTTAESSTDFYARLLYRIRRQDPARMRDLINRAVAVRDQGLRADHLPVPGHAGKRGGPAPAGARHLVKEFPDIQGYVLLTEGFWYKKWGGGHGASEEYMRGLGAELEPGGGDRGRGMPPGQSGHRDSPLGIQHRLPAAERRREALLHPAASRRHDPAAHLGKRKELRDRRPAGAPARLLDQPGRTGGSHRTPRSRRPAGRGMKVYCNADTFVCGAQLQTVPYHPFPYQWHERYKALEKYGVNGTLESWSTGYTPSFMTELRAWSCWSDAPPLEELLGAIAARRFRKRRRRKRS